MICTAKVLAHQTLRCPECGRQKDITPSYAGYSVRFDCCKSWMVSGQFEKTDSFMVMPAIKLTWTPIKPPVRTPYYGTDPEEWRVELRRNGEDLSYFIVDEYGEEVRGGGCWANPKNAEARLKEMITEELEAREQHGPDTD